MATSEKSTMRGALFALAAFGIFATHDVFIKLLGATYSPFQIIFFTTLMAFPLTTFMLMQDETRDNLRPHHPWWTAMRTVCAVVATVCAFFAFSVLPLAQTYAILFAMPLLITVLSVPLLGEQVGWRRGIAVLFGLAGVIVVLRPTSTELSLGHAAALGAALFGAVAGVIIRKIGREERSVVLILYPLLANFLLMAVLMPQNYVPMPLEHLGYVALISLLGFTAGLFLIAAYRASEAAIVAPMQYSQIVWATLFGSLLFGEQVDTVTFLGAAIIIGSGMYIVLRESVDGASSTTPVLRTRARGFGTSFRISPFLRRGRKN